MGEKECTGKPSSEVSPDAVYHEMYQEMRRFRDYELNASNWYTAILIGMAIAVFTARYAAPNSPISRLLAESAFVKFLLSLVIITTVFSAVYSILYVRFRYVEMREHVSEHLEPDWHKFRPHKQILMPHHLVLVNIIVVFVLSMLVVWL